MHVAALLLIGCGTICPVPIFLPVSIGLQCEELGSIILKNDAEPRHFLALLDAALGKPHNPRQGIPCNTLKAQRGTRLALFYLQAFLSPQRSLIVPDQWRQDAFP